MSRRAVGAAVQNLANLVPDSAARRLLPRVDAVIAAWNRDAAMLTTVRRHEALAMFGRFAFHDRDARLAGARILALGDADATSAVLAWNRTMLRAGLSDDTRDHRISSVRSFVRVACEMGVCSWRLRVGVERERAEVPDALDVEAAIERARPRDRALVLLAYDCRLALGACLELRVRDVDFGTGAVVTRKGRVLVTPRTLAALRDMIDGDDADPLFVGARGGELSPMSARRIFRALGLGSPDCVRRAGLERSAA